jgi:hypothetical protein
MRVFNVLPHLICALLALFAVTAVAQENAATSATQTAQGLNLLQFLSRINRYSALEGADSHGSIGLTVGAGVSMDQRPHDSAISGESWSLRKIGSKDETSSLDSQQEQSQAVPRIWLLKGMPWPVDFGISAAKAASRGAAIAATHVQWTVYEALAMPALALRTSHSRILGAENTQFNSTSFDLVASLGLFRYFTFYGTYGTTYHQGETFVELDAVSDLGLNPNDLSEEVEHKWFVKNYSYGLKVALIPGVMGITAESQSYQNEPSTYAAKLSFWL